MQRSIRFRNAPDTQIRTGRDEILTLYMELREAWERFEIEMEELVDADDYVVVVPLHAGIMQGSAGEVDERFGVIYALREGKITETTLLSELRRGPRSRRAVGVGDVGGERRDREASLGGVRASRQ